MMLLAASPEPLSVALLLAILLTAAVVGIRVARVAHVPRVVGYLVLGIACRFVCQWAAGGSEALDGTLGSAMQTAELIKTVALCLILFAIGSAFDSDHLKSVGRQIWKLAVAEITVVAVGVFVVIWAISRFTASAEAVFLGIAAIATAPAATLHVLRQYEAKGSLTNHIVLLTGLNNVASIVLFYIAFLILAETGVIHAEHMDHGLVLGIVMATLGSTAAGFALGLILSIVHIALTRFETLLIYFAAMFAVSVGAKALGMNYLIVCLFMGLAFTNFSIQPQLLRDQISILAGPIYALFFVLAGFNLELSQLGHIGAIGVAYVVMRTAGKIAGAAIGVRWLDPQHRVSPYLGTAMLCQAGVAIGLGKFLIEHCGRTVNGHFEPDPAAVVVNTVILASVALFELIGPLATKRAVVRAGEVKLTTLLVRRGGTFHEVATVFTRLGRALSRQKASPTGQQAQDLTARQVMRTNIETLAETAKMGEVLHFVERSRLNHFFVVNEEGDLVGSINFADLRNLVFNPMLAQLLSAYDMANTAPPVASADQPLRELLDLFHEHDVGSLPVIEGEESHKLLGVVEQRDVLRALHHGNSADAEDDTEGH